MSHPSMEPRRCERLVEKRARPAPSEPSPSIPTHKPKRTTLSNAERVKAYRQRVKKDPEKYQRYLDENKEKCKAYRENLSDEKKAEQRAKATLRKQKERQSRKMCQKEKMQTRTDILAIGSQRAKWREQKRQQAEKMHWRTREKRNERRRSLYRQKKQAARDNNSKSVQCEGRYNMTASDAPVSHPVPDPETSVTEKTLPLKISHLKVNQYVKVALPSKSGRKMQHFIGKIEAIDAEEQDIYVCFLKLHPSGSYQTWPQQTDSSWVKIQQIKRVMSDPWIDAQDHYTFN